MNPLENISTPYLAFNARTLAVWLVVFFCSTHTLHAQDIPTQSNDDSDVQQLIESTAENNATEDADYTNLIEALFYYKEHPINLNQTNKDELIQFPFLSEIQINNLLNHIDKNGKLITICELQGISGFDLQTIKKLLPYVYVTDNLNKANFSIKEMFQNGQHMVLTRYSQVLETQKGFTPIDSAALHNSPNSRYIGSPQILYTRYRFTYGNNVSWGFTGKKDQGELFFKNNQNFKYDWYENMLRGNQGNGFDFNSAHFFIKNVKFIRAFVVGDYQASFGQGLVLWSGLAFTKSANINSLKKSSIGIKPYTSANLLRYLRGTALTMGYKRLEGTAFFSRKKLDGTISDTLTTGEIAAISSLQTTGYHTTATGVANKGSVTQTVYGGNISYKGKKLTVGATVLNYMLDKDLSRNLSYYNQFQFSSTQNMNASIDYSYVFRNFNFFGEEAICQNGGKAFINGAIVSLDPRLSMTVAYRNYQRNYQNLVGNGFAENSTTANEKGTYIGISAKPTNTISFNAYYDRFEFPWMSYQANAPSHGFDYLAQLNYTPSKKFDMYVRIRDRNKQRNAIDDDALIYYLAPVNQTNYRFNISYTILPSLKLKNRIEMVDYKINSNKTQKGYLAYQDIIYNKIGSPLSVTLRYALFHTDSYDARIYAYETEVPGVYSILANYYRGSRFYILVDYMITKRIELWLRYSQTFYDDRNVISAGSLTEIQGNTKSTVEAQLKFRF